MRARADLPGHLVYNPVRAAMELLERKMASTGAVVDALALVELHAATGGGKVLAVEGYVSSWSDSNSARSHGSGKEQFLADKGWLSSAPLDEWHSVTADERTGRVTRLELRDMQLDGRLPPAMAAMTGLEFLDLRNNPDLELPPGAPMDALTCEPIYHTHTRTQALLAFIGMPAQEQRDEVARRRLVAKHGPDGATLRAVYDASGGSGWAPKKDRWFTKKEADVSKWAGITVGTDGRVVALSLGGTGITVLSENMVKHIGELSRLTSLSLGSCTSLTTLPESIGNLQALTELILQGCSSLTGHKPLVAQLKARGVNVPE